MSSSVVKLLGIAIITVFVILVIKRTSPDISVLLRIVCGVVLASLCVMRIQPIMEFLDEVVGISDISQTGIKYVHVLLKVLCVAILTHICSTVCRDCGEASIAYYAELGGKLEILILSLPLFEEILNMALSLVKMT